MNDVKMDWQCIMEEEQDTVLYSLNSSWRTSNRTQLGSGSGKITNTVFLHRKSKTLEILEIPYIQLVCSSAGFPN